jgi:uncharacterized protein
MEPQSIYYAIAVLLVAVGVLGVLLPALPGLPLVSAGMLLAAWADGFERIGTGTLVALGALTALSLLIDFWATAIGAKRVGASRTAIAGAVAGTFAGLFFGPIGLFAGPFIGALLGELWARRGTDRARLGHATKVGVGTWIGIVFGVALKLMLAFAMICIFAWAWFT